MAKNISRQQPNEEYAPAPGGNVSGVHRVNTGVATHVADRPLLMTMLNDLLSRCLLLTRMFESDLEIWVLPITDAPEDSDLRQAHQVLYPLKGSNIPNFISYRYYKLLSVIDSAGSKYIRQRYENAMRGVLGTPSLDLLDILTMIQNEATLMKGFVDRYVGNVDDSSEFRIVELFTEWTDSADYELNALQAHFSARGQLPAVPQEEKSNLTAEEAQQSQAIFQIKINSLNGEIVSEIALLKKYFSDYSTLFYDRFLGPALQYRLSVGRAFYPSYTSTFREDLTRTNESLNSNLSVMLADQIRRNNLFNDKIRDILSLLQQRDMYRGYVIDLQFNGKTAKQGSGVAVRTSDVPDDSAALTKLLTDKIAAINDPQQVATGTTSNRFESPHASLSGIDDPAAHPQYLLKSGGTITGSIDLAPDVTIGGIVPAQHAHTGEDGSALIDGSNIIPGTLTSPVVNASAKPVEPVNLRILQSVNRAAPPNQSLYDIKLAWETPHPGYSFEIQYSAVV